MNQISPAKEPPTIEKISKKVKRKSEKLLPPSECLEWYTCIYFEMVIYTVITFYNVMYVRITTVSIHTYGTYCNTLPLHLHWLQSYQLWKCYVYKSCNISAHSLPEMYFHSPLLYLVHKFVLDAYTCVFICVVKYMVLLKCTIKSH